MKIFVYGTLKTDGILHRYMEGSEFVKNKKLEGYVLYLSKDETYPLIYFTGKEKDIVRGEIWKINKTIKKRLDKYEEGYFLKKLLNVPIQVYYPTFNVKKICKKIPRNKEGEYEFNVEPEFYKGFYG